MKTQSSPIFLFLDHKLSVVLSTASACLLLGSCASPADSPVTPPPPGSAIIDAIPDAKHMDWVEGIELVSINGASVKGTRHVIKPGLNNVKTQFRWPQGQVQQADLRFYATPGIVYTVYYEVYPPHKESDTLAQRSLNKVGAGAIVFGVPIAALAIGERVINQYFQTATYIDLKVVAQQSIQGLVRQVRAYPDGRVDEKPWASWAQMKAP